MDMLSSRFVAFIFNLLLIMAFLIACTADQTEPIEATRPAATAVPPTPLPATATTLPTATAVPAANQNVPQLADPPTNTPTLSPLSLSQFLATLQEKLNARNFDALKSMMPAHFVMGMHPSQRHNPAARDAVDFLGYGYIPWIDPEIVIHDENIWAELAEPYAVETIFTGDNMRGAHHDE